MKKARVGLLGATGVVGQTYLKALQDHPFFEVTFLAASDKSAHKTLGQTLLEKGLAPQAFQDHVIEPLSSIQQAYESCDLIFSAIPSKVAPTYELLYAKKLPLISHSSYFRKESDIPLLIPEINSSHLNIIPLQQRERGFENGFIVSKPNCSIMSAILPLYPLHQKYRLKKITLTTLQSVSGAGYPGVSSMDILGNVLPNIPGEEEKSETEPLKILGRLQEKIIPLSTLSISAQCNRVPVLYGHLSSVSAEFEIKPKLEDILESWDDFSPEVTKSCPSAPKKLIRYSPDPLYPQPKVHVDMDLGMSIQVGRLRSCPTHHIRFVSLSHNVHRGAALGGLLSAELLYQKGLIPNVCEKVGPL